MRMQIECEGLCWNNWEKFKKLLIHNTRKINPAHDKGHKMQTSLKLSRCVFAIKVIFLAE